MGSGVAAAATETYRGQFAGQSSSSIGFSVIFKQGKPKKALITWGATAQCPPLGQQGINGVIQNAPMKKEGSKYVFEGDWVSGGDEAHIEGVMKSSLKKITGELDHSRVITSEVTCSFENLAFTANRK